MSRYLTPIWFNGDLIDCDRLTIDAGDRGLLLGDGAFETVPVIAGKPFRLPAHVDRLMAASESLGLGLERKCIEEAAGAILPRHAGAGILRITATRGPAGRGLAAQGRPSLLLTMAPWPALKLGEPLRLITATPRRNDQSPLAQIKSLSYLDNILAAREAAGQGADDALMLNTRSRPACSTISNLFMRHGNKIITPPCSEGVLPGITRRIILECAEPCEQRPIEPAELQSADEIFLTNSIRLVRPVANLDGRRIPNHDAAQGLLAKLLSLITAECGALPAL